VTANMNLGFVFDLHLSGGEQLGVHAFWHPGKDILPRGPNRQTESERPTDTEHHKPDDIPKVCVQEEEDQIHDIHDRQGKRHLVPTEGVTEEFVVATFDVCPGHDSDRRTEGRRQEEVRLHVLTTEDQDPKDDRCEAGATRKCRVGSGERLRGHVLP